MSTVRFDGAQEFGKSLSFQAFCRKRGIVMDPVAEYTHVQNARRRAYFIVRLILKIALHGNACMRLIPTTKFGMT